MLMPLCCDQVCTHTYMLRTINVLMWLLIIIIIIRTIITGTDHNLMTQVLPKFQHYTFLIYLTCQIQRIEPIYAGTYPFEAQRYSYASTAVQSYITEYTAFMGLLWYWERTAVTSLYRINPMVFAGSVTVKSRGRTKTETPHQMTLDVNLSGTWQNLRPVCARGKFWDFDCGGL
jgi:hypothetical protein